MDRLTTRYLDTLRDGLLDLHGIENEVRIGHLMDCIERGSRPVPAMLRDPRRNLKDKTRRMRAAKQVGLLRTDLDELAASGIVSDGGVAAARSDLDFYSVAGQIQGSPADLKVEDFWTFD